MDNKKTNLTNNIQKLNDSELTKVNGGVTEANDVSNFFKWNKISTTWDKCDAKRHKN